MTEARPVFIADTCIGGLSVVQSLWSAGAATELERVIARLETWDENDESVLTAEIREALTDADVAVLACTCFPMALAELRALFPAVEFLDPGAWCGVALTDTSPERPARLRLGVTGDVVSAEHAAAFARNYLDTGAIECCTWQ